ncbi:hypothetical protein LWI28_018368 [Acer negundo]|uniref:BHLH domain-containing protein n=1 Tax=Acer negundo TaxID=4023 RepID=A0AAD5IMA1_ACENE|nr:hypothetical protein LWI28_018368 [Acer negundo]
MAKECSESSVATSSSTPQNWWDLQHASSALSSWTTDNTSTSPWQHQNPNSNSSCEEEVSMSTTSFTYASNHSGLTVDSSQRFLDQPSAASNELMGEHAPDTHLWNHVLLNVGSNGELQNSNDVGENLLDHHALSSKSIYEPAYDYLKKMDNNWEFTNSTSFNNNFEKHINAFGHDHQTLSTHENERLNKLSNLVSHWSIAPPDPEINRHNHSLSLLDPQTCNNNNIALNDHHQFSQQATGTIRNNSGLLSYYGQDLKAENEHDHDALIFRRSFNVNGIGYHHQGSLINGSMVEGAHDHNNKYYYGMSHSPCTTSPNRNLAASIPLTSRLTKPLIDIQVPKPYFKSLNLSDNSKKQTLRNYSPTTTNGRERGSTNEGKKKRSEESSESVPKKPKNESSTASSSVKAPKVKLADKITALQQIVSPFGKTDTASVLYEAIGYIKFLQEQVQLLSNPYMKSNSHKDPWGGLERKEKGDIKVDHLRNRGLCLVPISSTPKVYHDNTGSDYWTPAYRGCLYR